MLVELSAYSYLTLPLVFPSALNLLVSSRCPVLMMGGHADRNATSADANASRAWSARSSRHIALSSCRVSTFALLKAASLMRARMLLGLTASACASSSAGSCSTGLASTCSGPGRLSCAFFFFAAGNIAILLLKGHMPLQNSLPDRRRGTGPPAAVAPAE